MIGYRQITKAAISASGARRSANAAALRYRLIHFYLMVSLVWLCRLDKEAIATPIYSRRF
ncbi:MAG: hypothetical protein KME22_23340 [Hassallia sp. WJT32-NPBG1]|nr:hypothetical protein [Hassallia sp. WJT32-NPBG1]